MLTNIVKPPQTLFDLFMEKVPCNKGKIQKGLVTMESISSAPIFKGNLLVSKFSADITDVSHLSQSFHELLIGAYVHMYGLKEKPARKTAGIVFEYLKEKIDKDLSGMTFLPGGDMKHWVLLVYIVDGDTRTCWLATGAMGLEFSEVTSIAEYYAELHGLEYTSKTLGRSIH